MFPFQEIGRWYNSILIPLYYVTVLYYVLTIYYVMYLKHSVKFEIDCRTFLKLRSDKLSEF